MKLRLWADGEEQRLSQLFVFNHQGGERLHSSECYDGLSAVCLANKGFTDTPQGHVSCMTWRGLVARLRNGFNMQEEGKEEEGEKKISLRVSETDSSLSREGSISWDRVTPAIILEARMSNIC